MFDIGFSELLVVFVVALIILGPERLPTAAKTAGLWIRKIRRSINSVQREINAQLDQEELQRKIEQTNQRILQESKDIQNTILPMESATSDKAASSATADTSKVEDTQTASPDESNDTASTTEETSSQSTLADKPTHTPDDLDPLTQDDSSSKKAATESTRS